MIHDSDDGVNLFKYDSLEDGNSLGDEWYESIQDALDVCKKDYGIDENDWEQIPDPPEFCQQDWIAPVRIVGRNVGKPQWGNFEKFTDGKWIEIKEIRKG